MLDFSGMSDVEIGEAIATYVKWTGERVLEIAAAALTDANFHSEAKIVGQMRSAVLENDDTPTYHLLVNAVHEKTQETPDLPPDEPLSDFPVCNNPDQLSENSIQGAAAWLKGAAGGDGFEVLRMAARALLYCEGYNPEKRVIERMIDAIRDLGLHDPIETKYQLIVNPTDDRPRQKILLRLEVPAQAADRLIRGFENRDPLLMALLSEFDVQAVQPALSTQVDKTAEPTGEDLPFAKLDGHRVGSRLFVMRDWTTLGNPDRAERIGTTGKLDHIDEKTGMHFVLFEDGSIIDFVGDSLSEIPF